MGTTSNNDQNAGRYTVIFPSDEDHIAQTLQPTRISVSRLIKNISLRPIGLTEHPPVLSRISILVKEFPECSTSAYWTRCNIVGRFAASPTDFLNFREMHPKYDILNEPTTGQPWSGPLLTGLCRLVEYPDSCNYFNYFRVASRVSVHSMSTRRRCLQKT